ncbi:MAG: hypothetical protein ACFFD2_21015 [Promethearchaeota archaeon]
MSQDAARFLPMMAEALKDIYTKMDEITKKLGNVEETLKQFFTSIGQKNMLIIQNLKKLQGVITDFEKGESLKSTLQLISVSVSDIRDGMWFLEFQKALSRFKEKIEEL